MAAAGGAVGVDLEDVAAVDMIGGLTEVAAVDQEEEEAWGKYYCCWYQSVLSGSLSLSTVKHVKKGRRDRSAIRSYTLKQLRGVC